MVICVVRALLIVFDVGLKSRNVLFSIYVDLGLFGTDRILQLHACHFRLFLRKDILLGEHFGHILRRKDVALVLLTAHRVACFSS